MSAIKVFLIILLTVLKVDTEVVDLECRILETFFENNRTRWSCQCKEQCGGGLSKNWTQTPITTLPQTWRLYASDWRKGDYNNTPKWLVNAYEEENLFGIVFGRCLCDYFTKSTYLPIWYYEKMLVATICMEIFYGVFKSKPYYVPLYAFTLPHCIIYLLSPIWLLFIMLSFLTVLKLVRNSETSCAFTLQLGQILFSFITFVMKSAFTTMIFLEYQIFTDYFGGFFIDMCNALISLALVCDRFLALTKFHIYKPYASRKLACQIILAVTVLSLLLSSHRILKFLPSVIQSTDKTLNLCNLGIQSVILLFIMIIEISMGFAFLRAYFKKVNATVGKSQMAQRQVQTTVIIVCTVMCDMIYHFSATTNYVTLFFQALLTSNGINSTLYDFFLNARFAIAALSPTAALFLSVTFSATYRKAFFAILKLDKCYNISRLNLTKFTTKFKTTSSIVQPATIVVPNKSSSIPISDAEKHVPIG